MNERSSLPDSMPYGGEQRPLGRVSVSQSRNTNPKGAFLLSPQAPTSTSGGGMFGLPPPQQTDPQPIMQNFPHESQAAQPPRGQGRPSQLDVPPSSSGMAPSWKSGFPRTPFTSPDVTPRSHSTLRLWSHEGHTPGAVRGASDEGHSAGEVSTERAHELWLQGSQDSGENRMAPGQGRARVEDTPSNPNPSGHGVRDRSQHSAPAITAISQQQQHQYDLGDSSSPVVTQRARSFSQQDNKGFTLPTSRRRASMHGTTPTIPHPDMHRVVYPPSSHFAPPYPTHSPQTAAHMDLDQPWTAAQGLQGGMAGGWPSLPSPGPSIPDQGGAMSLDAPPSKRRQPRGGLGDYTNVGPVPPVTGGHATERSLLLSQLGGANAAHTEAVEEVRRLERQIFVLQSELSSAHATSASLRSAIESSYLANQSLNDRLLEFSTPTHRHSATSNTAQLLAASNATPRRHSGTSNPSGAAAPTPGSTAPWFPPRGTSSSSETDLPAAGAGFGELPSSSGELPSPESAAQLRGALARSRAEAAALWSELQVVRAKATADQTEFEKGVAALCSELSELQIALSHLCWTTTSTPAGQPGTQPGVQPGTSGPLGLPSVRLPSPGVPPSAPHLGGDAGKKPSGPDRAYVDPVTPLYGPGRGVSPLQRAYGVPSESNLQMPAGDKGFTFGGSGGWGVADELAEEDREAPLGEVPSLDLRDVLSEGGTPRQGGTEGDMRMWSSEGALQQEVEQLRKENQALQHEHNEACKAVQKMWGQLSSAQAAAGQTVAALQNENQGLRAGHQDLQAHNQDLQLRNQNLHVRNQDLQAHNQNLEMRIHELEMRNEELRSQALEAMLGQQGLPPRPSRGSGL